MGCVRPPRDGDLSGAPPLPPKKRLRFRRKHKGKKARKGVVEQEEYGRQRGSQEVDEKEDEDIEGKGKVFLPVQSASTPLAAPDTKSTRSRLNLQGNTLTPGSSVGGLYGHRLLEVSPKPSPAWRGVFCLPGEEDTVSAIVDVSSIPSQTTTTTPVYAAPTLGSTTPGGGRVCRVHEKVQGVLEKPWILRQKKEKKEKAGGGKEKERGGLKRGPERTGKEAQTPSERKGVVHIREVDGKLCVVRTSYPSDYGSPVWRGDSDGAVEVRQEPFAPSPVTGNILKVQLSDEDAKKTQTSPQDSSTTSSQLRISDNVSAKGFKLDSPAPERSSLLESGYASDLPLTSPGTAGTTPSQMDWGGLTSSSSERLDSMMESPLALQQHAAAKCLPQVGPLYQLSVRYCREIRGVTITHNRSKYNI